MPALRPKRVPGWRSFGRARPRPLSDTRWPRLAHHRNGQAHREPIDTTFRAAAAVPTGPDTLHPAQLPSEPRGSARNPDGTPGLGGAVDSGPADTGTSP